MDSDEVISGDELVIELGDTVTIQNTRYGPVKGRVYYRDEDLISILPEGVSDRVYDFPLVDGEFDDSLGVKEAKIHKKHVEDGFVRLNDLRVGQDLETFMEDGERGPTYRIVKVDEEDDLIEVEDSQEAVTEIVFDYTGIPRDLPFNVMRSREPAAELPIASALGVEEDGAEEEGADASSQTPIPAVAELDDVADGEAAAAAADAPDAAAEAEDAEFDLDVVGTITLPVSLEVEDIPLSQQVYPDSVQKADALNDYISRLTESAQKDPRILRNLRLFIEMMYSLKKDIVKTDRDGYPTGAAETSVETLSQLFTVAHVPIGRPVLDVNKKLYDPDELMTNKTDEMVVSELPAEGIVGEDGIHRMSLVKETRGAIDSEFVNYEKGDNFWVIFLSYLNKYNRPWSADGALAGAAEWTALSDGEFFRAAIPDFDDPPVAGYGQGRSEAMLPMSLERALGPTYRRDMKRNTRIAFPADTAPLLNYVLFPLKEAASFGTTRTGLLAVDMNNSMLGPRWTSAAIKAAGGIEEVATGNGFVVLGAAGNTLGNIPLTDYLRSLQIGGRGFADLTPILSQLGLNKIEISEEVGELLSSKLEGTRQLIEANIRGLRERIAAEADAMIAGPIVEGEGLIAALEAAQSDSILIEDLNALRKSSPLIAKSGQELVAYLLKKHQDLFMAIAGGQADIMAKQTLHARRRLFLDTLNSAKQLRDYEESKGSAPEPNTCPHVALLRDIRRLDDRQQMFLQMVRLLAKYQGERDLNWINCSVCKQHLLCIHELLQMQQFLNPKEQAPLQKELVLKFSGPIVGGLYQCRNCGQGIAEIDFDKGMQFDDEGRPLAGRGEVMDEDELKQAEIENILGGPVGSQDMAGAEDLYVADTEEEGIFYGVIKELCNRLGIFPDKAGYLRIINNTKAYMGRQLTREDYVKKYGEKAADYTTYWDRIMVCAIAAFILIEVQTKIPDYVIRYTLAGCVNPGFFGAPLGVETDKTGIGYVSCAVASITKNEAPWNTTEFQKERNDVKRQQLVSRLVETILRDIVKDSTVQHGLAAKKVYLKETFGAEAGERPADMIMKGFLPRPYVIEKEEMAAEAPVVVEAARDPRQVADVWIQSGHRMAKKTAVLIRGSPFSEATCCLSEISRPAAFWDAAGSAGMPRLGDRRVRAGVSGVRLMVPFSPRRASNLLANIKPELYHRVFLNVCFRGPRIGQPHEPGLTLKCPWCEFVFPSHPRLLDYDGEGKEALEGQGVEVTSEVFQEVLDAAHNATRVPAYKRREVRDQLENIAGLASIRPLPSDTWEKDIVDLMAGIKTLTPDATDADIAVALAMFSDVVATAKGAIMGRVGGAVGGIVEAIMEQPGATIRMIIYSYCLVPFQRLVTQLDQGAHQHIPRDWGLSETHMEKIIKNIADNESLQKRFVAVFKSPKAGFANAKVRHYVRQMTAAMGVLDTLSALNVRGGEPVFQAIMQYFLCVPLATMLNPNKIPDGDFTETLLSSLVDSSTKLLTDVTAHTLQRYRVERMMYSEKELQERIQVRIEKEAMSFVKIFDDMTDEMKAIEKIKKKHGIGRWAIGGTKLIYAYDADRYDAEREERIKAGILDDEYAVTEEAGAEQYGLIEEGDEIDMRTNMDYEDNF